MNGTRHSVPNEPPGWAQVLVFGSLCPVGIQLQAREDLTVQEKKRSGEAPVKHKSPWVCWGVFLLPR